MKKPQQGYVLLVMIALVLSAGLGLFVTGLGKTVVARKAEKDSSVLTQLKNVKQRLLTYAATHPDIYGTPGVGPGHLPCPTRKSNATAADGCNGTFSVGWLPRKVTGHDITFEPEGLDWQQVWYVLDNRYAVSTDIVACGAATQQKRCRPLNAAAAADRLTLNNRTEVVALLIYAGRALAGQSRNVNNPDPQDYLDGENGDGDGAFVSTQLNNAGDYNDIVLPIYKDEWARVVRNRVIIGVNSGNWCGAGLAAADDWFAANDWNLKEADGGVCP